MCAPTGHTPDRPTTAPPPAQVQRRRSPVSFAATDVELLAAWLRGQGWRAAPGRSPSEHSRMLRGRQLVVIYHSGSVLVQVGQVEQSLALLAELVGGVR
jgi:hypothetical protein